ncbi:hypothetical protein JKA74_12165 [Marivirga sp. S37H4]|uniref:Lipocalin-like domain-containing protein n=1 Tax=Marivirga aurantiaca TaxID=2802615 RepID=A0A934WZT8_9BACT|nr:hypothetical protein [Marivirga aurantiaca]MBK6265790.1 hypothetical protein [Marivirga aurantiaca]
MKITQVVLIAILTSYTLTACAQAGNKNANSEMTDCENTENTVSGMEEGVSGNWAWQKSVTQSRLAGGTVVDEDSRKGLKIHFSKDKTGIQTDREGNQTPFSWSIIKNESQNSFHINTEPNLFGNSELIVCDMQLKLLGSAFDGADNYFYKVSE